MTSLDTSSDSSGKTIPASARAAIAFIHWGAWGDLYVSTASLKEVAEEFPDSPLWVVGPSRWLQILDPKVWPTLAGVVVSDNGKSGEVHRFDRGQGQWQKDSGPPIPLRKFFHGIQASFNLRTESFRFSWAPLLARVPRRHGSAPGVWQYLFYTHRAPWLGKDPLIHERDRMLQVVEAPDRIGQLSKKWSESSGLPRLREPDWKNAERLARASFGRYWLLNPTSSRREKAWPSGKFRELFSRLQPWLAERGTELRVLGAPNETEWLKEVLPEVFLAGSGTEAGDWIVQPPSILDLMDVLAGSQVLITNTSSAQFLAPGLEVRTVTLMGRSNPVIWGPLGKLDVVIQGRLDPNLGHDIFLQEQAAYQSISVDHVFQQLASLGL